ncbi:hypothetical protein ACKKBF_B35915 [Auxenochlorella protothecoides x Auxenochlorella symbiontica]
MLLTCKILGRGIPFTVCPSSVRRGRPARPPRKDLCASASRPQTAAEHGGGTKTLHDSIAVVETVMAAVTRDLFLDASTSYVMGEESQNQAAEQVMQEHLGRHVNYLDENFLEVLQQYIASSKDERITDLLKLMRQQVLQQLSRHLQSELQVLTALSDCNTREARQAITEQYLWAAGTALPSQPASAGSGDDVPDEVQSPTQRIRALANAASQVVAHMEAADKVLDRRLLARLCLVLLDLEEETASPGRDGHGAVTAVPNAMPSPFFFDADSLYVRLEVVPPHIMAFVKELLAVPGPDERIGALTRAFATGWSGRPGAASSKDDIRPGKFLYVLGAIRALLPAGANQRGPALGLAASPLVLERLAAIQRDARAALIRAGGLAD